MIEAIITVHENGNYTNQFMNNAIIHSVASTRKTQNRMKQLDINERELRVLRLICDGHTSQEIADTILTSKKNLDLIRTKLMKKFKVKSANELIRASIINGLYTPRSNEEIKMEQENENMLKKLRKEKTLNQNYYHN
jgi:DNA-binding NarL/FixJ family response regulator